MEGVSTTIDTNGIGLSRGFVPIHFLIRPIEHRFGGVALLDRGDSDRDAQGKRLAVVDEVAVGGRNDQPVGDLHRARFVGMIEQDGEFVAAKARNQVGLANRTDHQFGKVDQRRIARGMSE